MEDQTCMEYLFHCIQNNDLIYINQNILFNASNEFRNLWNLVKKLKDLTRVDVQKITRFLDAVQDALERKNWTGAARQCIQAENEYKQIRRYIRPSFLDAYKVVRFIENVNPSVQSKFDNKREKKLSSSGIQHRRPNFRNQQINKRNETQLTDTKNSNKAMKGSKQKKETADKGGTDKISDKGNRNLTTGPLKLKKQNRNDKSTEKQSETELHSLSAADEKISKTFGFKAHPLEGDKLKNSEMNKKHCENSLEIEKNEGNNFIEHTEETESNNEAINSMNKEDSDRNCVEKHSNERELLETCNGKKMLNKTKNKDNNVSLKNDRPKVSKEELKNGNMHENHSKSSSAVNKNGKNNTKVQNEANEKSDDKEVLAMNKEDGKGNSCENSSNKRGLNETKRKNMPDKTKTGDNHSSENYRQQLLTEDALKKNAIHEKHCESFSDIDENDCIASKIQAEAKIKNKDKELLKINKGARKENGAKSSSNEKEELIVSVRKNVLGNTKNGDNDLSFKAYSKRLSKIQGEIQNDNHADDLHEKNNRSTVATTPQPIHISSLMLERMTEISHECNADDIVTLMKALYETDWRTAYKALTGCQPSNGIKNTIEFLSEILKVAAQKVRKILKNRATHSKKDNVPNSVTGVLGKLKEEFLRRHVKDLQEEHNIEYTNGTKGENTVSIYSAKCVELVWFMFNRQPSMVLDYDSRPMLLEDLFEVFKPYKGRGNCIHYVVWPAIRRCHGGTVIAQGIADFR